MNITLAALNSKYVHSNLALKYLKASLENNSGDYEAVICEYTINDNLLSILTSLYETNADIYAFSCYIWNIEQILKTCENLKKLKPKALIILGGPEVSYDAKKVLENNDFIDFIISGEGENSLPQLINTILKKSDDYTEIEGLAYKNQNGNICLNEVFCVIDDLSTVTSPFKGDLSCYRQKVAYFESSRGCPYNCSYCLSSTIKGVRYFPLERVKQELLNLIQAEAKQVKFVDRTFNSSKERAMEIWRFITENNKNTVFHFEISAHLIDDEMIEFLNRVPKGIFEFEIGIQSTNQDAINAVGRKTDFKRISQVVQKIREKNNIHLHLDLIAGLPYEGYQSFGSSFDNVYRLKPHMLQLGFLKLLKGSRIRDEYRKHGYKFTENPPYEVLENKYISFNEITKLKRIEAILEIYKNSGRFEYSIEFLIKNSYESPFKMFEEIACFWLENKAFERKIAQEEIYDLLFEFYKNRIGKNLEAFSEVLKFDYVLNNFGAKDRYWEKKYNIKNIKNDIRDLLINDEFINMYIPHLKDISLEEKLKRLYFEVIGVNLNNPERVEPVLIMFEKKNKSRGIKKSEFKVIDIRFINCYNLF